MSKLESAKDRFKKLTHFFKQTLAKDVFQPTIKNTLKTIWTDTQSTILSFSFIVITVLTFTNFGGKITPPTTTLSVNHNNTFSFPEKEFTDHRDQQKYPMLKINNRWWMGKNLNFKTANASCYNDQNECSELGMLYTWEDAKSACPKNWRLPTEEEWSTMLRATYGKSQECSNCYAALIENGESGFEGKLGGFKSSNGSSYFTENNFGYYWTETESDALYAEYFVFSQPKKYVNKSSGLKNSGYSCRCILEEGKEPSDTSATIITAAPQISTPAVPPTKAEMTTPSSQPTKPEISTSSTQSTKPLFKTGSFVDRRNNQTYPTVQINGKWWMAENLNYPTKGSFYYEDDKEEEEEDITSKTEKYGLLYTWKSAQKACPKGWRLPSDDEWLEMTRYIGKNIVTKEATTYDYLIIGGQSQFNAVFGGVREKGKKGKSLSLDELGHYWSSTKKDKKEAWFYGFSNLPEQRKLTRSSENKDWGLSCRCIKN